MDPRYPEILTFLELKKFLGKICSLEQFFLQRKVVILHAAVWNHDLMHNYNPRGFSLICSPFKKNIWNLQGSARS